MPFWFLFTSFLLAQRISFSPYGVYGYGTSLFNNDVHASALGGVETGMLYKQQNLSYLTLSNPASLTQLEQTVFTTGINMDFYDLKTSKKKITDRTAYFSSFSLGFPLAKNWGFAIGFQPFSGIGWSQEQHLKLAEDNLEQNISYRAKGGLNTFHAALGYKPIDKLSFGLRFDYLFGNLAQKRNINLSGVQRQNNLDTHTALNGTQFTLGGMYTETYKNQRRLTLGATYGIATRLSADKNLQRSTYVLSSNNQTKDQLEVIEKQTQKQKVRFPARLSLGASYGADFKWNVGFQYDFEEKIREENIFLFNLMPHLPFENKAKHRFAVGGYWIPRHNSYQSYLDRVTYKAGLYFERGNLSIKGKNINDYGLSLGLGLPIGKKQMDAIQLSFNFGQRGTTENNLIRERYARLKLSFTLNNKWFKRVVYE